MLKKEFWASARREASELGTVFMNAVRETPRQMLVVPFVALWAGAKAAVKKCNSELDKK